MKLYEYQQIAYQNIISALQSSARALIVMATGLGKTIVSAFIAKEEILVGKKGLFLCHENDILDQALCEYRLVLGDEAILRTFYGESKDWLADQADVLFASFQSFNEWHKAFDKNHFDFIIVDESHHGQAPTYSEVIKYFEPEKLLGMTATPDRNDAKDIRDLFGEEVVNYSLEEAIANGWLANVDYHILHDHINTRRLKKIMADVLEKGERISVKQLNESIFIKMRDTEIAKIILSYNSKQSIVFCENIDHVENFAKYLSSSSVFHSKLSDKHNKNVLQKFKEGKTRFILSVNKFNEGVDVPEADLIVFLRSTDSETIFRQQLGRGLRRAEGKDKVVVLDFVANLDRLAMLKELTGRIQKLSGNQIELSHQKFFIEGANYNLTFDDELVDLITVLERLKIDFYPTWQEASRAAIALGIKSSFEYAQRYREDPQLISGLKKKYPDFPGWHVFLEREGSYKTWQEASKASIALGIKSSLEYKKRYREDLRLINFSNLKILYPDFPGWDVFLWREGFYKTWQEASRAAIALGIKTSKEYRTKYKHDSRLPSLFLILKLYPDFPGWDIFFRRDRHYKTWQEASEVVISLGIKTSAQYSRRCKEDPKLIRAESLKKLYPDFPGWDIFLGRKK